MKVAHTFLNVMRIFYTYSICIMFVLMHVEAKAQNVHNTSNLYVPTGMQMSVNGSVLNEGFVQNNGQFSLKGDWINHSVYQGNGRVIFEGLNQTLFNNAQAIEQVVIEGGGLKTVQGKLIVSSQMDFIDGLVMVADTDTLMMGEQCEVTSASASSYVEGAVTSTGTGYKFYPVGKNGKYHPVEFLEIKGLLPVLEVEVAENLSVARTDLPAYLLKDIYWTKKLIDGTFESTPVTLAYSIPDSITASRLIIAHSEQLNYIFAVSNVTVQSYGGSDIVSSVKPLTENIFALGERATEIARPFYISTTLSANASNPENRVIKVFGDQIAANDFLFEVYNRWGTLIYDSQSFTQMNTNGWDGRQSGTVLQSGVYPYSLKYQDSSGNKNHKSGFITIIN